LLQRLPERGYAGLRLLVFGQVHEHANVTHPLWLLCARLKRPRRCRAAEDRDELSPPH
jgi:hypothetical protein